jgi:predicted transcriptional regulator
MGEKPTGRLLVVMGLFMASLMVGFASADTNEVRFLVDASNNDNQSWYDVSNPLTLAGSLINDGDAVTVSNNPVCPLVLNVYDTSNVMLVDGEDACPDRSQGLDLFAGEQITFDSLAWDMKTGDGDWLVSGTYTVEVVHVGTGLSHTLSATIQTPVFLPSGLTYEVDWIQRTSEESGAWLGLVSLHNPSAEPVDLNSLPACWLEHRIGSAATLGAPCFGDVSLLMPGEVMLVDQRVVPVADAVSVEVALPGDSFVHTHTLQGDELTTSSLQAGVSLTLNVDEEQPFGQGDVLVSDLRLSSLLAFDQVVEFTSSCRAEMWVLDDLGNVVFDSRQEKVCQSIELEQTLEADEDMVFDLPQWNFFDSNGCSLQPGMYTVVAELPEFHLAVSEVIEYRDVEVNGCTEATDLSLDASSQWSDDDTLSLSTSVVNTADSTYLRMIQPCTYELNFVNDEGMSVHRIQSLCGEYDGRKVLVPTGDEGLNFAGVAVEFIQDGVPVLSDGFYTLEVTMQASSKLTTSVNLAWPPTFTGEDSTVETTVETPVEQFELTGSWTGLLTDTGTCYVLEMDETMYLLSNARTLSAWTPSSTVQGVYVAQATTPSPACGGFSAPSVEVVDVVMERSTLEESSESTPVVVAEDEAASEATSPVVTVATVVVTTSILSLLAVMVATNEGLRLPATMAGLWFIGLLGKTHETTDGRYQRGRLMGYLTANPGCHFRALMSALDMSNGQITHHLRILEAEEHVWRKNDGRLVRYYPLTNQLNPNTSADDLPVPPLSPDPNSLQGKILNLLDQDGDMGQFPTQAELAKRLEKSQQLISHHLRTLQKYGLVERRKMGVMNRYKLTREAIFLLETSDDFGQK